MNEEPDQEIKVFNTEAVEDLNRIRSLTSIMDSRFKVPGTNFTFGLDPILGLIPGVGDILTFIFSGFLVLLMARHKVKGQVLLMMLGNIGFDFLIGAIPVIGWIADFRIKANSRNLRLLEKHYVEGKYQRGFGNSLALIFLILVAMIWLFIWGIIELFQWMF